MSDTKKLFRQFRLKTTNPRRLFMTKTKGFLVAAGIVLAMVFAFSCSSGGGGSDPSSSNEDPSSSSEVPSSSSNNEPSGDYCDGTSYNPSSQFCDNNVIYQKCGGEQYRPSSEFCSDNAIYPKCNGGIYDPTINACTEHGLLKIAKIGTQTWMAENLNRNASGSKCYNNIPANCGKYGRLYDWSTALTVCPSGWHLPTNAEWRILINYAGGSSNAGKKLKARSGWDWDGNGTDDYWFEALPGGFGDSDDNFDIVDLYGLWWTASEYDSDDAYAWTMNCFDDEVEEGHGDKSTTLFSVRCVQD
jgi:uncharacterized protein (TIGR02145 family)